MKYDIHIAKTKERMAKTRADLRVRQAIMKENEGCARLVESLMGNHPLAKEIRNRTKNK